jgi:O-antigen/teichoic acid export membrane protein
MSQVKSETKLLAKHSTIYAIGNLLQKLIAFILLPLYTRYLTPDDYGVKELVAISTDVIGVLVATGISSALFRFYFDYEDPQQRNRVISSTYLSLGALASVAVAVLFLFAEPLSGMVLNDPQLKHYLMLGFGSLWFKVMNDVSRGYLRANQKSLHVISYSLVQLLVALSLNIYFLVYLGLGVVGIFYSSLIVSVLLFLFMTLPVIKQVGLGFSMPLVKEMLRFGLPLVPSQLGGFVVHLSDRFFIKEYLSIADAGLYSLSYRLGTLPGTFIVQPFNQTWLPRRFEIHKQPDSEQVFGRIFTYFLTVLFFAGLAVAILSKEILMLLAGSEFWSAYRIVPLIVIANLTFSLHYHFNFGLLLQKRTKLIAVVNISNGVLVLLLNWLLIPRFGVFGAAYATILAFVYKVSLTWFFSRRYYRPHFESARILKLVVTALVLYGASRMLHFDGLFAELAYHCGLICTYPVILLLVRFFTPDEIKTGKSFISNRIKR